jgi:hypothetical protein
LSREPEGVSERDLAVKQIALDMAMDDGQFGLTGQR